MTFARGQGNTARRSLKAPQKKAFERFYFSEAIEVSLPLGLEVRSIEQFHDDLGKLGNASFHYHFVTSQLCLDLRNNDFSLWFSTGLGMGEIAQRANGIDIYTNAVDAARQQILYLIGEEIG